MVVILELYDVEPTGWLTASNCTTLMLGRGPAPYRHAIVQFGQPGLEPMVLVGEQIRSKPAKHMYNTIYNIHIMSPIYTSNKTLCICTYIKPI
jgi:hypothetical protein